MTHIKLMIDHNLGQPVADGLNEFSGKVKAATTIEHGFRGNTPDDDIVASTNATGHILLTRDHETINEHRYPPCTHGGIIVFRPRLCTVEEIVQIVKAFCLSGYRKRAEHSVTHLHRDKAVIHTHDEIIAVRL